jgi:hypothetical protein
MNRGERRAQWRARYRAAEGRQLRDSPDQRAEGGETHAAIRVGSPACGAVRLHIEEVLFRGFSPHGRYAISDAIRQEFTGLLIERGVPSALSAATGTLGKERVDAGAFRVVAGSRPRAVAVQVADAVYRGLSR